MMSIEECSPFGKTLRTRHFPFSQSYLPLNHGSYGATPNVVREAQIRTSAELDARPDAFIRFDLPERLAESRRLVAELLNCHAEDVVLMQNATTAIDTVLRNLCGVSPPEHNAVAAADNTKSSTQKATDGTDNQWFWQPGDTVVYYEGAYPAIEKALLYTSESKKGVRLEKVEIEWPISDDDIVRRFEETIVRVNAEDYKVNQPENRANTLSANPISNGDSSLGNSDILHRRGRVRLAVFDTVVSMPGMRVPWERLVEVCRVHGVLSLVDGAHGLGQIPIDIKQTKPDFFTTNLHKWLFVPRGCAAFYVSRHCQHLLRSTIPTSLNFVPLPDSTQGGTHNPLPPLSKSSPFVNLFSWTATVNYTGYLDCVRDALEFRRTQLGGEDKIMEYQNSLAKKAGEIAAEVLRTEILDLPGSSITKCAFTNVRLPLEVDGQGNRDATPASATSVSVPGSDFVKVPANQAGLVIPFLQQTGVQESGLYPQVIFYRRKWWWRISAAPYVDESDVRIGAEIVKALCERIGNGDLEKFKKQLDRS